jgi:hypothetical protein
VEEVVAEDMETVNAIHRAILAKLDVTDAALMKPYTEKIPATEVTFEMMPITTPVNPDPAVTLENGNFEKIQNGKVQGFTFPADPKPVVTVDNQMVKEGNSSLRFENIDQRNGEAGRLEFNLNVKPSRLYRVRFWNKTEGLNASNPFGSGRFRVDVYGGEQKRQLNFFDPQVPATGDWRQVECGFNTKSFSQVKISIGVGEGKTGRFWLDDLRIEEVGMVNILRRPGTPLTVKNEKSGQVYQEGADFAPVEDIPLNFRFDHDGPDIKLLPGGRIREGDRLRVGFYHVQPIYQGQTPACMSEPKAYEIWRRQAELFHKVLNAKTYFLGADEIRLAASCAACQARKMTAAQILGNCVTRQIGFLREYHPPATIVLGSDMFDPTHNAKKTGSYYLVDEDFYGAWNYIPKDNVIIALWKYRDPGPSLQHFDSLGFKTVGASYYDRNNLDLDVKFLDAMDKSKGAAGIIYTTWLNKYELLEEFGKLVDARWGKVEK